MLDDEGPHPRIEPCRPGGLQPPRRITESSPRRERQDYPDRAVRLRQDGRFRDTLKEIVNTMVAGRTHDVDFGLGGPGPVCSGRRKHGLCLSFGRLAEAEEL